MIEKSDYEEPRCPLAKPSSVTPIPTGRVIEKLDEYYAKNDMDGAERHLQYWLATAEQGNDERGRLTVLNEQVGLYRKLMRPEALTACKEALRLGEKLQSGTITLGTTLINVATAYKAFGDAAGAMPLYERARKIYEKELPAGDARLGGLYNNMALAAMDLQDYSGAETLFRKALSVMEQVEDGKPEQAITYCNLADLTAARQGMEDGEKEINACLETAMTLLDAPENRRDGSYAYVCEKCAPTFGYYGFFRYENELNRRTREIYERT